MDTKLARAFYNAVGVVPQNDPEQEASRAKLDLIFPELRRVIKPGMRVLDLGCGAGRYTFGVEELGAIPVGIDCAEVPLAHARQVALRRNSQARFVEGDYTKLPFKADSFEAALLISNLLECSYDDFDAIAKQLQVILTPGGVFCMRFGYSLAEHDTASLDHSTGRWDCSWEVPDHGQFPQQHYFWIAAFAKHIAGRYLTVHEEDTRDGNTYWLTMKKVP